MDIKDLTVAQCVLLTVRLASESNIKALHSFTPNRLDALDPELVLRILLTYLPEAVDPHEYTNYVEEVASRLYVNYEREDVQVNTALVADISDEQAQKRVKKLSLLPIQPPMFPTHAPRDLLTWFVCHRAYRIDAETGLLNLVSALVEPFLDRNDYLRTWYISVVLPLLRLEVEYYPEDESLSVSLESFDKIRGKDGVELLLRNAIQPVQESTGSESRSQSNLSRDVKSVVGPWMYGYTRRKRRESDSPPRQRVSDATVESVTQTVQKISLDGVTAEDKTGHDWEIIYRWLVQHAIDDFDVVSNAIDEWDGPADVDLGGYDRGSILYLDEDTQRKLELQYAQAAFASCYSAQADTEETIRTAHGVLARLAELLDFVPPPDLASSVDALPKIERHVTRLEKSQTVTDLLPTALLRPEHPLTTPRLATYMLLQMMVYSAYQFSGLGHSFSIINVAKLHFYATAEDQLEVFKNVLRSLSRTGARRDETQWSADRAKLLWLWNWGIEADANNLDEGAGVLGKISKAAFEEEMLKVFTETTNYRLVAEIYISGKAERPLPLDRVEQLVLAEAMESYDNASNCNKTRGSMKKANDIVTTFRTYFPNSRGFQQASALIAATHALSFYSLTLQHAVPFQPVSIRISQDPLALISKVLEQNPRSYSKLDDLIGIARNFVSAGLALEHDEANNQTESYQEALSRRSLYAERRVTFMAIEAALREDDFETAYSYIVSRLTPPEADINGSSKNGDSKPRHQGHVKSGSRRIQTEDDVSWRAAFLAGRYRPSSASPPSLRRLEQRTELLSLALLLAPVSALSEILAAWRRCEEESTALQLAEQQAEQEFDDNADKLLRGGSSALPGNFTISSDSPELILNQKRREMGRMGAGGRGNDETPLSMFVLTRNAAQAFSKNAFPLRPSGEQERSLHERTGSLESERPMSPDDDGQQRVRKRDMVANAVSGGLASGLGWVLGATPVGQQDGQQQQHER